jgi:hypothetical protein
VRSPNEDDRRVANVGARSFLNIDPVRLEGVWMPFFKPSELPPFEFDNVAFQDDYPTKRALENGLYAGRLHLELASFEASVSYLYGFAHLPGFSLVSVTDRGTVDAEVTVARQPYRHQVFGLDFSTALGDFLGMRGEAAYRVPEDYETTAHAPRPDLQYVLGLDRSFGPVSVIAQYVGRYTLDWEDAPIAQFSLDDLTNDQFGPDRITDRDAADAIREEIGRRNRMLFQQLEELQHMVSLRLEWLTLHDTLSLSALGMVNLSTEEWLLYPKLGYQFSDNMSGAIGGEIYAGPTGTLLGLIDEKLTAGYAELKFSF